MIRILLLSAALLVAACASQAPQTSYYLLRSDMPAASAELSLSASVALGEVTIAPYIDQQGLLLETAAGEVRAARQHLWAEPVRDGIIAYLSQEISQLTGEDLLPSVPANDAVRINIRIDQFHGTLQGQAVLVAYWWLTDNGTTLKAKRFTGHEDLAVDGYAALAKAEKTLLSRLARDITATVGEPPAEVVRSAEE